MVKVKYPNISPDFVPEETADTLYDKYLEDKKKLRKIAKSLDPKKIPKVVRRYS